MEVTTSILLLLLLSNLLASTCAAVERSKNVKYYSTKTIEGSTTNFDVVDAKFAYMLSPSGLCEGLNGEIYISDIERHLIYRIYDQNWSTLEVYAGFTTSGFNGDGQSAVGTLLNTPTSVAVNPLNGDLFIADTLNDMIRIVSYSTKLVSSISHTFNKPKGVTVSKNGNAYIADTNNNLIWKYEIATQTLSILGGGGYLNGDYDGVDAKSLLLKSPKNIYVYSNNGKNDIVYFTDEERVKSIDENGFYRIVDGGLSQSNLYGIYVSNEGEIYTSSQSNHFIQMKKEKSSATLLFIGSSVSESGYEGDNQLYDTSSIKFYEPSSLIVNS